MPGEPHRWDRDEAVKAGKKSVESRRGNPKPMTASQWRKAVERAVRYIMTHDPADEPRKGKWMVRELREFKQEDRAGFYGLLKATLPSPTRAQEEARTVSKEEVLGGSLNAIERFMAEQGTSGGSSELFVPNPAVEGVW